MRTATWSTIARHGRMELAHGHRHRGDAIVDAAHLGDARRQSFEELVALGRDDPTDRFRDRRVVDGVVERVGGARGFEVHGELDVDLEGLRARLLLGEHTVHPQLA